MKSRCECRYKFCCDCCWSSAAKTDPCQTRRCKNPRGHAGDHGALRNTQMVRVTADDINEMLR